MLTCWTMNGCVLIHVTVTENEIDDDYDDGSKAMTCDDDDHQNSLLPYLLDVDQHRMTT